MVFTAPTIFAARQTWPIIFGYPQVAVKALLGGGAEFALQRAAYLGGDAQGGAVFFRDIDGLDALIANGNRPFNGPVG